MDIYGIPSTNRTFAKIDRILDNNEKSQHISKNRYQSDPEFILHQNFKNNEKTDEEPIYLEV